MKRIATAIALAALVATSAQAGSWNYSSSKDEMRGIKKEFASVVSDNKVDFAFPYNGGTNAVLTVRKIDGKLDDVLIIVSPGQIVCSAFKCVGAVKFENGSVEKLSLLPASDGTSKVVFVKDTASFVKKMSKSGKVTIELEFYREGTRQFTFDVSNYQ